MTEIITLQLGWQRVLALQALADGSAEWLFGDRYKAGKYVLEKWSMETATGVCDEARAAV